MGEDKVQNVPVLSLNHAVQVSRFTWTPKVCRIMAFMAVFNGFGLLFYLLVGILVEGLRLRVESVGFGSALSRLLLGISGFGFRL